MFLSNRNPKIFLADIIARLESIGRVVYVILHYRIWLTPTLTIAFHAEDLRRSDFDILLMYMFRFVYKTKNRNNISLVVFLKIRHIGYSIPNIF